MMGAVVDRWNRFWFPEVPLERVAVFRIAVTLFALVDVAFFSNYVIRYTEVDRSFLDPVVWLALLGTPIPSRTGYAIVAVVMVVSLAFAAVGYRTRYELLVAAPLFLYHWSLFNSWGKINHGKIPVIIALFVLIAAPAGARLSVDAWRRRRRGRPPASEDAAVGGWALRVVGVSIVSAYVLSVVAKLRNTGLSWVTEPILQAQMLVGETWLHQFLLESTYLLIALQAMTIVVEAAAVLIFVGGWVRNLLLAMLAGLHLGSYVLLETEFFGFLICYVVFFELERILPWVRSLRGPNNHRGMASGDIGAG